jgi:hypothetical protein
MDNALYRATFELTINSPLPGFECMTWLMPSDEAAFDNLVKEYSREANITEIEAVQFIKMKLELDLFGNDLMTGMTGSKELHLGALCQFFESGLDLMDVPETVKGMDLLNHMLSGRLQAEQVRLAMIEVQHEQHDDFADYVYARDRVIQELLMVA